MQKQNKLPALLFGLCLGLFVGILAGVQLTKNQPVIYEWKAILKYPYFELTANGKHVPFPDHIKLPSKPLDNKKKGGDLPPVAFIESSNQVPGKWAFGDRNRIVGVIHDPVRHGSFFGCWKPNKDGIFVDCFFAVQVDSDNRVNVQRHVDGVPSVCTYNPDQFCDMVDAFLDGEKPSKQCPCDPCDCTSCACHLTKPVMQKIEGGPKDDKSLLGIGDLAAVLREFKEAIFGTANKPGLRDDIANGLRDYTRSIAVVTTLVLVAHFACFGFVAYNLHRIAERPYQ